MKLLLVAPLAMAALPAVAGPPYVTDDPEPAEPGQTELYFFFGGATTRGGWNGSAGADYNYGIAPDWQLTAVLPFSWNAPDAGPSASTLGNTEIGLKYRFLHQADAGVDVALFPRVLLPAGSADVGEHHASLLVPIWVQHSWNRWTTFGGGGCELNHGGDSRDFCLASWAVTAQLTPSSQVGAEIFHQGADTRHGLAGTGVQLGMIHDINARLHLAAAAGPGIQNTAETGKMTWYAALLLTY